MKIRNRQFAPGPGPTVATIIFLVILVNLGLWQVRRADEKASLHEQYLARGQEPPLHGLSDVSARPRAYYWRNAVLSGVFIPQHTFLLDNQVIRGRVGYFVYSVLELMDGTRVLVNRGWVAAGPDRRRVEIDGLRQPAPGLKGVIKPPPATGWLLSEDTEEQLAPGIVRLQEIDPADLNASYDLGIEPYIFRLSPDSPAGFLREWRQPGSGKEKHLGYAFQWFALALALVLIYFFVNIEKKDNA